MAMRTPLLLAFVGTCTTLLAQPGILDPAFGTGGITITDISGTSDIISDLLIRPDGKIVTVCSHSVPMGWSVMLARYTTAGVLDSTFGTNGVVISDFGGTLEFAYTGALTVSGGIVVCGSSDDKMMMARYLENGTLDSSFDGDGVLIDATWESDPGFAMTQQPDGKVLVYGQRNEGNGKNISMRRLNADGTLDTSWDGDGYTMTNVPGANDLASSASIQPDGKVLVCGSMGPINSFEGMVVIRYNADGSLDTGFNSTGIWTYTTPGMASEGLSSVIMQADGKVVGAGHASQALVAGTVMVRLNADGTMDTSFDGDGLLYDSSLPPAGLAEVMQEVDGKLIVFGNAPDTEQFLLARYMADGTLDPAFGTNGYTLTTVGGSSFASTCEFMNDGRILGAGGATPSGYEDLVLACYQNDVGGVGVTEPTLSPKMIAAYPNPARDIVNLRLEAATGLVLKGEVLDAHGHCVRRWSARVNSEGSFAVDIADLPSGSYLLRCALPGGSAQVSVVKY